MRIVDCKTNHITNPVGFDLSQLRVSWKVEDAEGRYQRSARVIVAGDPDMADVVFDTGSANLSSLATPLEFSLNPRTRYYWTVTVESDSGEQAISGVQYFETAKLDEAWAADWLSCPNLETDNPVFERELILAEDCPDARLYICGLGLYEAYVNGEKVGREYLAPGCNDYNEWLQYQAYPVALKAGINRVSVSLGNGWFKGRFGMTGKTGNYGREFLLIAELWAKDTLLLKTDDTWLCHPGDIRKNGIYDGEVYAPCSADRTPYPVTIAVWDKSRLKARRSLPVVVRMERKSAEVIRTPAGETVLDMGQNMAGFIRFHVHAPAGRRVRLQYGEILQDGNFYRDNLRSAKAEYVYLSDGQERVVEPHFTYYGFRYVKIEGLDNVDPDDFTGCVLSSDLKEVGNIQTDNPKLNRLFQNVLWGQRSNYVDIPTDCPQRDERLGWTGDTQVFAGTACFNMDSYAFLDKYMVDVAATQRELGFMPSIVPAFDNAEPTSCAWGDVSTIVPWTLYQFYGDEAILRQQYDSMRFWVDSIIRADEANGGSRLWETDKGYGDWLALDHDNPGERYAGGTDLTFLHTAYYYYSADIVAKTAQILGYHRDAERYGQLAEQIRYAFQLNYFTPTGRLAVNTQTAYAVVLYMGLTPEGAEDQTAAALADKIRNGGGHLKTGFIGTPILCRVLSRWGYSDVAYQLLLNEDHPSWLYAVNLGATTIWERWNSMLPDGHINGTDMNSFNHYSYGAIAEWMYTCMAGLQTLEPGFKSVKIAPEIDARLRSVAVSYNSPAGLYEIGWEIQGRDAVRVSLYVPFDAIAKVYLPGKNGDPLTLESGQYEFTYQTDQPLWEKPNTWSPFNDLRSFTPAVPLLDRFMPGWRNIPGTFCQDSLRNMSKTPFVSITDEQMDMIDEALSAD